MATCSCPENARIMVVDDEPVNLKLLDRMLEKHGYQFRDLVQDPREASERYQTARPDVILLDINMPHMDGLTLLRQLQALDDPLFPPVIILTAEHGKEFLLRALAAGARDYISKPFNGVELIMRVRNLLDAHLAHCLLYDKKTTLEELVRNRTEELQRTRLQAVQRLGMAAEYRDEETGNHVLRMSHLCALMARTFGWSDEQCDVMLNASPMHDIGKIGIPDAILRKPGRLEPQEWEIMKSHASIGAELLAGDDSELMRTAQCIALTHHEKWDGSGYPVGLKGEAIPMAGRIAALADVFDALTSERPYKKAWSIEMAMEFIRENRGVDFDPELVDLFERNISSVRQILDRFRSNGRER